MKFQLKSNYQPTGDQPQAIEALTKSVANKDKHQTLLGVTGSGKTFSVANVIENTQKPTLVIAHNKTLAAQLYQEFRDFFPSNAVSYFVSYYDYYQPEAYIPTTDTYIEKEATINDEIDKLRLAATTNLLTRPDTIVVASVSCIYNLGSPVEYGKYVLELVEGEIISRETLLLQLANLQYDRSDAELRRGSYRLRGDVIQLWPAYEDRALRIDTLENQITKIDWTDPITGSVVDNQDDTRVENMSSATTEGMRGPDPAATKKRFIIYPAKHYMMNPKTQEEGIKEIEADLQQQLERFKSENKIVEAYRLQQKVQYDLEMIREFGFVNGIENYSRHFDNRKQGDPPFTLLDYFAENAKEFGDGSFLTVIDESHITLPQIRGMYHGDRSRKETLIEYGFRLPSALDNRPLTGDEFMKKVPQLLYVSATPETQELSLSGKNVVEQLIRPTGLVDPNIELRPPDGQIEDLVIEILRRKKIGQRVLVTTLTKKMSEALTEYLNDREKIDTLVARYQKKKAESEKNDTSEITVWNQEELPIEQMPIDRIDPKYFYHLQKNGLMSDATITTEDIDYPQVAYLHSDIETLDRSDILDDLREGKYDVVVGINLLREGLDLPEVSLVAILDADKAGFLRSRTSLIQTMGRAARHQEGNAILYAQNMTQGMKFAIEETLRRRRAQIQHNLDHNIEPVSIQKPIRRKMITRDPNKNNQVDDADSIRSADSLIVKLSKSEQIDLLKINPEALTPADKNKLATKLKRRMNQAAKDMDYELAAILRDSIKDLA